MSILSFWEFKDEVRKMKLHWQQEAAKWISATGEFMTTHKPDWCFLLVCEPAQSNLMMCGYRNRKCGHGYRHIFSTVCTDAQNGY
jgi:hypothetical protein